MAVKRRPRRLRAALATLGVVGLGAACTAAGTGSVSTMQAASLRLEYSCTFPLIGSQTMMVEINADIPSEVTVGEPTGEFQIEAIATVNEAARSGLSIVGAATLEGSAQADANLSVPNMELPVEVAMSIPTTDIPTVAGDFDVHASGSTPSLTFNHDNVGTGTITVNDLVLNLAPRDANGNLTGLGEIQSECTLTPGQDNTLHTFTIVHETEPTTTEPEPTTTEPEPTTTTTEPQPTTTTTEPEPTTTTTEPQPTTTTTTGPGEPIALSYDLSGQSFISAANGTVPLNGSVDVEFDLAAGTYTGNLQLAPTSGEFNILGFLPTSATIEIAEVGETSGSLTDGVLTASTQMDITLTNVNTFGFLPLGGGPDCKTVEPAAIELRSPEGELFDPLNGGTLTGTYTLPPLDVWNCGFLGFLIDIFVQGPNNTIELQLTATN